MVLRLKYATAGQVVPLGTFVDSTDGDTEKGALTIANTDIMLWKNGATSLVAKNAGGATYMSNGVYYCTLDATDTNASGPLFIYVHVATALPVKVECDVIATAFYYAYDGANFCNITSARAGYLDNINNANLSTVPAISAARIGYLDNINNAALSSLSQAQIFLGFIEGTVTLQSAIKLIMAACAGKSNGGGTATLKFRDQADGKDRITATVDANGNRTAITTDLT